MLRYLIFSICLLSLMHHISGQQIQSAEYRYGVLEFEAQEGIDYDSELMKTMKSSIEESIGLTVNAFQDSMIVSVLLDSLSGDVLARNLYDLRTNQHYVFNKLDGNSIFTVSAIDPNQFGRSEVPPFQIINSGPSNKTLPGLELVKLDIRVEGKELNTMSFEVATNVDYAPYSHYSISPFKTDSFVTSFTLPARDIHITVGVVEFQEGISHPDWFDTSTEGYEDARWVEEVAKSLSEREPAEEAKRGQGINQDIFKELKADDYLKDNGFGSGPGIIEKYDYNIDINGFLNMLSVINATSKSKYLVKKSEEEILSFFKTYGIGGPVLLATASKFDEIGRNWRSGAKWEALNWAALQDQLSEKDVRVTFAKNLQPLKSFKPEEIQAIEKFVAGEIDIELLLLQINGLYVIGDRSDVSLNDFDKVAKDFYSVLFAREFPNYQVNRRGVSLTIRVNETDYALDLGEYRKVNRSASDYSSSSYEIVYTDTFELDSRLFNAMADVFDHVAFDNDLDFTYTVKKPENLIQSFRYFDQTAVIMEHCPELKLFEHDYYLKKESPNEFHAVSWVPLAFEQKYWFYTRGIKFNNFFEGGLIPYLNFVTKSSKESFLEFVKEHQAALLVSEAGFADIVLAVNTRPYKSPYRIVDLLSGSILAFQESDHVSFLPNISSDKNTFSDVFPELDRLFRGTFIATDFTYNQEEKEVTFNYGNKTMTLPAKRTIMLEEAWKILKQEGKTDRILYPQLVTSYSDKKYLYLTSDERKELEDIFDISFRPHSQ